MDCIRVENLRKTYTRGGTDVPVLKGVSLSVARAEMVAIMGASGSGKTTLINLLGLLDQPDSGGYTLDGREVTGLSEAERALLRNQKIGFVFQNFNLLPRLSALENVMVPMGYSGGTHSNEESRARAHALLERVGLGDRVDHEPARLSGGEQQRVAIARALVNSPSVLIADEPTGNLDSATGKEVLAMFQKLNAEDGITMILVTHDEWVAKHAMRTIRIRDGLTDTSASSEPAAPRPRARAAAGTMSPAEETSHSRFGWGEPQAGPPVRRAGLRDYARTTRTAVRALRRNVLRSVLTTLGIIIGVASLITIAEIGKGSAKAIISVMESTGANTLLVQAGAASSNGVSLGSGTIKTLTPEDAEAIANECSAVSSLAPIVYARRQVVYQNKNWVPIYIYGTTPGLLKVRDWENMAEGEAFTDEDVRNVAQVCLIGRTLVNELFGEGANPVGKEVLVNDVPLRVVGVLSAKGTNIIGIDQDDILLAPWTTIKYRVSGGSMGSPSHASAGTNELSNQLDLLARRYPRSVTGLYPSQSATQALDTPTLNRFSNVDSILVRANSGDEVPLAMAQVTDLLRERHRITPDMEDDFDVLDFTEVIKAVQKTVGLVAGLLMCVALVSLAVGGVGIMNIMLVSVTERYREIGLRMAVGATAQDILRQFLVEAVVLCVLGGLVGLLAGRSISVLVRVLAKWPTESSAVAVLAAVGVSVTVGIVFGYYPAWKASRLNPIEALRYE